MAQIMKTKQLSEKYKKDFLKSGLLSSLLMLKWDADSKKKQLEKRKEYFESAISNYIPDNIKLLELELPKFIIVLSDGNHKIIIDFNNKNNILKII